MELIPFEERKARWVHEVTSPEFDLPPARVTLPYVIVGCARSGTTMLCSSLAESGSAGYPMEYFHTKFLQHFVNAGGQFLIDEYIRDVMRRRTSSNGRFGVKILADQYTFLFRRRQDLGLNFLRGFQRFIRVVRRDKVDQAISFMLALEHRVWNTESRTELPGEREFQPGDVDAINRGLKRIEDGELFWTRMAQHLPMSPLLELAYEDLHEDPQREVARVMAHLDIDIAPKDVPSPKTLKLAGEVTQDIKQGYLRAMGKAVAA